MIKVVFEYRTKKENLEELMEKFQKSASDKFTSSPSNVGIEMYKKENGDYIHILLDIYYKDMEDYKLRTKFERSLEDWNDIWFNEDNKHEEVRVEVYDVLKER